MKIELTKRAIKDIASFDKPDRKIIIEKIEYLATHFDELKQRKKITELKGKYKGSYRCVVARKIRIIFNVENEKLLILIVRVGKRKDVY